MRLLARDLMRRLRLALVILRWALLRCLTLRLLRRAMREISFSRGVKKIHQGVRAPKELPGSPGHRVGGADEEAGLDEAAGELLAHDEVGELAAQRDARRQVLRQHA